MDFENIPSVVEEVYPQRRECRTRRVGQARLLQITILPLVDPKDLLLTAIFDNDLQRFITYIHHEEFVLKAWVLETLIRLERLEMLQYLFSNEALQDEARALLNSAEIRPFFYIIYHSNEQVVWLLLNNGADIYMKDESSNTILHYFIKAQCGWTEDEKRKNRKMCMKFGEMFLQRGFDVYSENSKGETLFYIACQQQDPDWCNVLIYYGANPATPDNRGILPISLLNYKDNEQYEFLASHVFDLTFDSLSPLRLSTIIQLLEGDINLLSKIIVQYKIDDIIAENTDFMYLQERLCLYEVKIRPANLRLFLENYRPLFVRFLQVCNNFMTDFTAYELNPRMRSVENYMEIWNVFVECDLLELLIETVDESHEIIVDLSHIFSDFDKFTYTIIDLMSRGLNTKLTFEDLAYIYVNYGFCELFRFLLHMDFEIYYHDWGFDTIFHLMAILICNVNISLDDLLNNLGPRNGPRGYWNFQYFDSSMNFFSHPKLYECLLETFTHESHPDIAAKVERRQREVPLLLELARNVARSFVIKRFDIKNIKQFLNVVQRLPIGTRNKKILTYEIPIYE